MGTRATGHAGSTGQRLGSRLARDVQALGSWQHHVQAAARKPVCDNVRLSDGIACASPVTVG